ncbi:MAG TPA: Hsp33 family molecular chaperone HslO [Methylibium sp.]|uniref:Hsp33 family molecular chaperone HslO n=1 Tax=Methylibium sp. TaxID=2067992 RepID=UPI002DB8354F|nr:Hsp33 family molecular chaperone HslO [Methylibium sp.]HEU4460247.1 Hsp33 family molecular chaperone HslO [Methylibium sp.]
MSELHKFLFEGLPVRGMLVRLTDAWGDLLARRGVERAYPQPVRELLGEMSAAAVLMQANIKFDGALILQLHGDGPVKLAVAEAQPDLALRATATLVGTVEPGSGLEALVNPHGRGRCAITLDPRQRLPGQQPYQGVVPLHGDRREPLAELAQVLEHYMLQSEQLDTKLVLAADDKIAAGLLIQRLPVEGAGNLGDAGERNEDGIGRSEDFKRIAMLAGTLTRAELLSLDADTLLRRLFWEENLRRFAPLSGANGPRFACSCSRGRVARMLAGLGRDEFDSLIAERGEADVTCEFCGARYRFDAVDSAEVFSPPRDQPPTSRAVQ